ncbi:efflux RND transporter permease subunit [Allokutzneria sp. A3M-2-11 16]|uniref:efflux RND transporter permease subunit n=1 Tax=Allokutzneria sp. A3M-2-11 16 TaxID=2962043 RepID=UPI0020B70D77|nr:efflux RND transporter permease subunit [Allokutzneria sp. A3M-2-11 16]MCP3802952.1 efflux RND transporter permease subunit [Allokutzneria sp. A3M-2-11 16]
MSFLARFSLANRGLIALIALAITGFGAWAVPALKQQMLPDLELPTISVVAPYPGSAPAIVESQVTIPIERAVRNVAGVTETTAFSRSGSATVQITFEYGTAVSAITGEVERAVTRIATQLPENVTPRVVAGSTSDLPVVQLAASGGSDEQALATALRQNVLPELQGIEGVREAALTGARDPRITITPDTAKMLRAGLTSPSVSNALKANGITVPGGTLTENGKSSSVSVGGAFSSVDDLENLPLTPAQATGRPGTAVKLGDVATVEQGLADSTTLTRTNGRASLGVGVTAGPDGNAVAISHAVNDKLPQLRAALGQGAALTVVFDQAPFVERSIEGLTTEGLLGLVFAVLVILVFLFSVRSTLVTAVSIPLSVLIALIALWMGEYSLNMLTLGALTIAVGRVVDDSIVVLENIKRHLGYGEAKGAAITTAVGEVAGAVTSSTLTTVAVFAPIAVVGGMVGQLFAPFALTVTVALLASLVVSLTIVPVLAYWFLKPATGDREEAEEKERNGVLQRSYVPVLRWSVTHRATVLLIAGGIFVGTLALVPGLKTNFIGGDGQNTLSIKQEMPVGTSLATTDAAAKKIEGVLGQVKGVQSYQATIGGGGGGLPGFGGPGGSTSATFSVTTDVAADQAAIEKDLRTRISALMEVGKVSVGAAGGGFDGSKLEVVVQGPDDAALARATEQVRGTVAETPGTTDVASNLTADAPLVDVRVDRQAAARAGLTEAAVGQVVGEALRGTTLSKVVVNGTEQEVVLRGSATPSSVDSLKALQVPTLAGPVRLDSLAEVETATGPTQLSRVDGTRSATVTATATGSDLGATSAELAKRLEALKLPAGSSFEIGGATSQQQDAFADLGVALVAAVVLVFLVMVATFHSLVQPLILLVSVPFAATGALGLLLVTGTPLGVPALIGLLMLVGIVVTNAIVLIDLINHYRAQGLGATEAIVEGGRHRLRPILMTALATIGALTPMALGLTGGGGFISQPLAVVVIGGLVSSTLLTLVVVPVLYAVVDKLTSRTPEEIDPVTEPMPKHRARTH